MIRYVAAYIVTLVVFLAVDAVWLTLMADRLYRPTLGDILLPKFLPAPALAFYLVFIVGVMIFAVSPAMKSSDWTPMARSSVFSPMAFTTSRIGRRCEIGTGRSPLRTCVGEAS